MRSTFLHLPVRVKPEAQRAARVPVDINETQAPLELSFESKYFPLVPGFLQLVSCELLEVYQAYTFLFFLSYLCFKLRRDLQINLVSFFLFCPGDLTLYVCSPMSTTYVNIGIVSVST